MSARTELVTLVESFSAARVLCVGDLLLDRYISGSVERISPEAPIPVLRIERERAMLGGAGNVARNLAALGASVELVSVRGDDAVSPALDRIEGWRRRGLRVGFTNGCFDLPHPGHISLLTRARASCDRLVVGLNSDASVSRLKGRDRPVQTEAARATLLATLTPVDLVVVFHEDTPQTLIRAIRPDVLVKGADYRVDEVAGAEEVQAYGGRVLLLDLIAEHSTTATISRVVS